MKELNIKAGVFLTTYTQLELDSIIGEYVESNNSDECIMFMDELRSFNPNSPHWIIPDEAIELTGLEVPVSKKNPMALYANYKGAPLGISVSNVSLYFSDPILSLMSAFQAGAPNFDFDNDFFHIRVVT